MKKVVIILICLSLLICPAVLSSCGDKADQNSSGGDKNNAQTNDNAGQNDNAGDSTPEEEVRIFPDIPEDLNFGGYKFRAFYSSVDEAGVWGLRDIVPLEEDEGEVINDAVIARNIYLEEKYNFEIAGIPTTSSSMTTASMRKVIQSGSDDYDVLFVRQNQTGGLITNGCLVDLNTVPYLDLDKPWWDKSIIDQLSVGRKSFAASGDIISTNSNALRVFLFNKQMVADLGLEMPYALVRENKWTLDAFYNMCKDVSKDVNGDGVMDEKDQYGYLAQSGVTINMFYAAGLHAVEKNGEGIPSLVAGNEKMYQVLSKINEILSAKDAVMLDQYYVGLDTRGQEYVLMGTFEAGRGLFFSEVLQLAERMRGTDTVFGILPPPKADENQAEYMSFADSWCMNLMLVPTTNDNLERTGQILEAMCAESKYGLRPAYYEKTLKGKYSRDDDSEEMLDIIIKNKVVSLDEMFEWGMHSAIQDTLYKRTGDFTSMFEKNRDKSRKKLEKTIDTIENLD